jgi:sulfatase maturation enzyme AslB (radical SAM superfamily)
VEKFIKELSEIPNIRYIHFLGGETLYLKSFYTICNRLIELDLAKTISIGTTTNATVYNEELVHIIKNFKHVHLGISIETYTALNDYIRWPSEIGQIGDNINKLMNLREESNLQMSLRITPNIFTVYHLDSMFEFMINNKIIAESCNILSNPSHLRMELLPDDLRQLALEKIQNVIDRHGLEDSDQIIINRRREDLVDPVISSVIFEYKKFLKTYIVPDDVDEERYNLVKFIKAFESIRHNTILDHLPEYEKFLRRYGY